MKGSDWIKVSDRLPKDGECVLVYDDLEGLVTADYEEDYGWTNYEVGLLENVTHWQPIELPEEE
jgi:hypothetical protein